MQVKYLETYNTYNEWLRQMDTVLQNLHLSLYSPHLARGVNPSPSFSFPLSLWMSQSVTFSAPVALKAIDCLWVSTRFPSRAKIMGNHKPDLVCSFHITNSNSIIKRASLACLQPPARYEALGKGLEEAHLPEEKVDNWRWDWMHPFRVHKVECFLNPVSFSNIKYDSIRVSNPVFFFSLPLF